MIYSDVPLFSPLSVPFSEPLSALVQGVTTQGVEVMDELQHCQVKLEQAGGCQGLHAGGIP